MEVQIEQKVILELSLEEVNWLRNQMQNPLHGETPYAENIEDKNMRSLFFNALNKKELS